MSTLPLPNGTIEVERPRHKPALEIVGSAVKVPLTIVTNAKGSVAKVFSLKDGKLAKSTAASVYEGTARVVEADGLAGVLKVIDGLSPSQALTYGVPIGIDPDDIGVRLVTQEALAKNPGAIARDRAHFGWKADSPGVLFVDVDRREGHEALGSQDIDTILCELVPGWTETERVWRPSNSAFIYGPDGKEYVGRGGLRCYVIVDDAAAIPAIGGFVYQALWDAGHGYILVTTAGHALDRSLIDAAVWQPERLDFATAPVLRDGLTRRTPPARIIPGRAMLASADLKGLDMSEWRRASPLIKAARKAAGLEIETKRKVFVDDRLEAAREAGKPLTKPQREALVRAVEHRELSGELRLAAADGKQVTVAELLADPGRWDGGRFADPLEPDYRNDKRIAYASLKPADGKPYLFSWAHGGVRYALVESGRTESATSAKTDWREGSFSAATLRQRDFPPIKYVLQPFVPEGVTLLAGRPKSCKSWALLDWTLGVAGGDFVMHGIRPAMTGDVLYLALEDNDRRLHGRINKLIAADKAWPERATFKTMWRRLDKGGLQDIEDWCKSVRQPSLIGIDTLEKVRPVKPTRAYADDYDAITPLQELAGKYRVAIVVVTHTRKMEAEDVFDTVTGTLGVTGSADTIIVIKGSPQGVTWHGQGRDIEAFEKAAKFEPESCRWRILGEAQEVQRSVSASKILEAMLTNGGPMAPRDIADDTGLSVNVVKARLRKLVTDGDVTKLARESYAHKSYIPPPSAAESKGQTRSSKGG